MTKLKKEVDQLSNFELFHELITKFFYLVCIFTYLLLPILAIYYYQTPGVIEQKVDGSLSKYTIVTHEYEYVAVSITKTLEYIPIGNESIEVTLYVNYFSGLTIIEEKFNENGLYTFNNWQRFNCDKNGFLRENCQLELLLNENNRFLIQNENEVTLELKTEDTQKYYGIGLLYDIKYDYKSIGIYLGTFLLYLFFFAGTWAVRVIKKEWRGRL